MPRTGPHASGVWQGRPPAPGRSIVVQGTAVPRTRFTPHLREGAFGCVLPWGIMRPELLLRQDVAGGANQRLLPLMGGELSPKVTDGRGICKA
jgi:hypothetical protein